MAEPVTIGGQTFIKTAEGWVDQKSKAKAPEGLLLLLNRLQVENSSEGKKKRVRIDTSRPIVKLGKTEYVWDLNSNVWIDKKTKDAANPAFSKLIEAAYQGIVEGTTGTTEEEKLYENWAKKAAAGQVFSGMGVAGQAAKQKVKTPTGGGQLPVSNIKINSPIVQMIEKLAAVDGYLKQRLDNQKKIANKNLVATKEAAIEAKSEDASPIEQNSQADAEKSDATGMGVALLVGGLIASQFEPVQEAFKALASGIKSVFNFVGNVANTISDGLDFFTGGSSSSSQSTAVDTSVQPNITQGNTPSSPNVAAPSLPAAPSEPTETTPSSTASSSSSTPAAMPNSGSNKAATATTGRSVATRTNTSSGTTSNSGSRSAVPSPSRSNTAPPPAPSASPRVTPPSAPAPSTPASPNATPVTGTPPQTGAPIDLQKYSYKDPSHVKGFNPDFASKLGPFLVAAEQAGVPIRITSGFRSIARQKELFAQAVKEYGSEKAARKWVAPPGKSNHNYGAAADLDIAKPGPAQTWAHANAARFGLTFPMSWEPWHIEIPGTSRYNGGSEPGILDQVIATGVNLTKGAMEALGTIARASFGKQEYVSGSQLLGFNDTMSGNIAKAAREKTTAMVDLKTPENAAASIPAPISLSTSPSSSSSGMQGAQTESDNSNIDWYLIRMGLIAKVNYEQAAHG